MMTGLFHISLFECTVHVDRIHVRFKIITKLYYLYSAKYMGIWSNAFYITNRKHYACATRSAFIWYRCEISYRSEILAPLQQPRWTHAGWLAPMALNVRQKSSFTFNIRLRFTCELLETKLFLCIQHQTRIVIIQDERCQTRFKIEDPSLTIN